MHNIFNIVNIENDNYRMNWAGQTEKPLCCIASVAWVRSVPFEIVSKDSTFKHIHHDLGTRVGIA